MVERLKQRVDNRLVFYCFVVIALNLFDAFATLRHIEHGAEEVNPFMNAMLQRGEITFLLAKHCIASIMVFWIALHPTPQRARAFVWAVIPIYTLLAIYQTAMFYLGGS